jgi:hypothetical protein
LPAIAPHHWRKRCAPAAPALISTEYLQRTPFSLQKIHWNTKTKTALYRSRRSSRTKRNFEVFKATDFLAAAIDHIPPRGQQTLANRRTVAQMVENKAMQTDGLREGRRTRQGHEYATHKRRSRQAH